MNSARNSTLPQAIRRRQGFSLLEVLVALAILAIGLVAALRAGVASSDTAAALRTRVVAGWIADNQLAWLRAQRTLPALGEQYGEVDMAGERFRWQQQTRTLSYTALRQVDIVVTQPGDSSELARLSAYLGGG